MFEEKAAAGPELVADQSEAKHPTSECVFLVGACDLLRARSLLTDGLLRKREAELNVAFDLSRVKRTVKKAELDRPLCEESVEVEAAIATIVIVVMSGGVGYFVIPDHAEGFRAFWLPFVQLF